MNFKEIDINNLIINPENDRHGPLGDEQSSIEWFFDNKSKEMLTIANDIAEAGRIYDPILVKPWGKKYIVFDGNRRTTCAKLIHTPKKTPRKYSARFEQLHKDISEKFSKSIICQIETDQNVIDRIVERRHNGTQGGLGQLNWDPYAKANHANRVSGKSDYSTAQLIESFLTKHRALEHKKINRSSIEKIADSIARRARIGFKVEGDTLIPLRNEVDLVKVLARLIKDAATGQLTLNDLLRSKQKNNYLDILEADGTMPPYEKVPSKSSPKTQSQKPKSGTRPQNQPRLKSIFDRDTLIPRLDFEIDWIPGQNKIDALWVELQTNLKLPKNKLATAILFRVFLELVANKYLAKNNISSKNKLSKNWVQIVEHQFGNGFFDENTKKDFIKRVSDENSIAAVPYLHRILHSSDEIPSSDDLKNLWDSIEQLVVRSIKA